MMKISDILIYGDSNTWGLTPNLNNYSKDAKSYRYDIDKIWWCALSAKFNCIIDGLCGRAVCSDNPWVENANAIKTISRDIEDINFDMAIFQLGTNDCKDMFNNSCEKIVDGLSAIIKVIKQEKGVKNFLVISPSELYANNSHTQKYYRNSLLKSRELDCKLKQFCLDNGYLFVSGLKLKTGEDGEHLTEDAHKILGTSVLNCLTDFYQR